MSSLRLPLSLALVVCLLGCLCGDTLWCAEPAHHRPQSTAPAAPAAKADSVSPASAAPTSTAPASAAPDSITSESEPPKTNPPTTGTALVLPGLSAFASLSGPGFPLDVEPSQDNLVISCLQPNRLLLLRLSDRKIIKSRTMPVAYAWLTSDPRSHDIYATSWKKPEILVLDPNTLATKRRIALLSDSEPSEVVVNRQGALAFVGDVASPVLCVVDLKSAKMVKHIELSDDAGRELLLVEELQKLYVGLNGGVPEGDTVDAAGRPLPYAFVDVIDLKTLKRTEKIACPGGLVADLAVAPNHQTLYILSGCDNILSAVSIGKVHRLKKSPQPLVLTSQKTGRSGLSLAYDASHNQLLVCHQSEQNEKEAVFKRVDAHSFQVRETLAGGGQRIVPVPAQPGAALKYLLVCYHNSVIHSWDSKGDL